MSMIEVLPEQPHHDAEIEALTDLAFGPDRFTKTVYKFRDGIPPIAELGFVIEDDEGRLVATLRFWPALLPSGTEVALLGPISVSPELRGLGYGRRLIHHGMMRARALGYPAVILVGDRPYYAQFGFSGEIMDGIKLPGPVDRARVLGVEFVPDILNHQAGMLRPARPAALRARYWGRYPGA